MSVSGYREILEKNTNVKVLHLFRDPRAVIHSRINTQPYPLNSPGQTGLAIDKNIQALCQKMALDLKEGTKLAMDFPNRFRFVMYEDIYESDTSMIELHSFVGMSITKSGLMKTRKSFSDVLRGMEHGSGKQRKENNSFWWRNYLSWSIVKKVDMMCGTLMQELGYQTINSEKHLRQFNKTDLLAKLTYILS